MSAKLESRSLDTSTEPSRALVWKERGLWRERQDPGASEAGVHPGGTFGHHRDQLPAPRAAPVRVSGLWRQPGEAMLQGHSTFSWYQSTALTEQSRKGQEDSSPAWACSSGQTTQAHAYQVRPTP